MLSAEQVAEILGGGITAKTVLAYRHGTQVHTIQGTRPEHMDGQPPEA
jgi:hypothetical protein